MKDRLKEINYQIFLESENIKLSKKKIKALRLERENLQGQKRLIKENKKR